MANCFTLALVQMLVLPGEPEANLAHASELTERAAQAGAQIVLLPEALPFGWTDPSACDAEPIPGGAHFEHFRDCARRNRVFLCTGMVERAGDKIFNSAILLSPEGALLLHYRKIHELAIAHDCYSLGDRLAVAETPLGMLGLMICADGFAPEQVITRTLALMGAQLILSPSAWAVPAGHDNTREPYGGLWINNYGAVARDFPLWIAGCSNIGPIPRGPWAGRRCIGSSLVIRPGGPIAVQGGYETEEIIHVRITLASRARCGPAE